MNIVRKIKKDSMLDWCREADFAIINGTITKQNNRIV